MRPAIRSGPSRSLAGIPDAHLAQERNVIGLNLCRARQFRSRYILFRRTLPPTVRECFESTHGLTADIALPFENQVVILRQSDVDERRTRAPAFANYRQRFNYHREDLQHYSYRTVGRKLRLQLPKWATHSGRMAGTRNTPEITWLFNLRLCRQALQDGSSTIWPAARERRERPRTQSVSNHHNHHWIYAPGRW